MKIERDRVEVTGGRPARPHAGRPDRADGHQPRLRELGGADEPVAGGRLGGGRCTCRGPATPTWSAPRSTGSPTSATSSSAPARARPRPGSPVARVAKALLRDLGVTVFSHVIQITGVTAPGATTSTPADFAAVDESPVRCLDAEATRAMVAEIDQLRRRNESLGGVFEVRAFGLVPGLGSHVSWEERLDGRLGQAILLDPGDQGGRDRRRASRSPACPVRRPTTRSSTTTSAATTARPTARAASRAG